MEACIQRNTVVILPIGTTEEHGKHLPVETDALIARFYGDELAKACEGKLPVLVTRTISYGFSMKIVRKWPGCPCISPETFTNYIFEMISSLVEMGFKKVVLLDCHGNHDCLLRTVMRKIADKYSVYIMTLRPHDLHAKLYQQIKRDPAGDCHGGEWETSAIMHIAPHLVHPDKFTNVDAIRVDRELQGPVSTWGLQETTTGLFGDPTYATAELGKKLMDFAISEGVRLIERYYRHSEQSI
jgi:creatinine amidohydrolase